MLKEKIIYKDELPINVVTANIEEYPIHFHDDMEVVYVLEGSVILRNGYYTYNLKQGDIFILNDREMHSFQRTDEDNLVMMFQMDLTYFSRYYDLSLIHISVSIHHRLAVKERLTVNDLHGETLMLMRRNWSHYVDMLRDDLRENHPEISIEDFDFYDVTAFNKCENNNCVLMAIENWKYVHPLLKILPVDWGYTIPFGLLHSPEPSPMVSRFLKAVEKVLVQQR